MAGMKTRMRAGRALKALKGAEGAIKSRTRQIKKYNTDLDNGKVLTPSQIDEYQGLINSVRDMQVGNAVDVDMSGFKTMKEVRNVNAKNKLLSREGTKSKSEMASSKSKDNMKKGLADLKKKMKEGKAFEGFEGEFDFSKMDPREYGAPTRDAEGVSRNYKGGMKKPKKMNMGGQMENRFTKKDYRKGGLFR